MIRLLFLAVLSFLLIGKTDASAVQLPDIDIPAHCANIGSAERVQRCMIVESYARLWLVYHPINLAIFYRCSLLFQPRIYGYLHLRACIVSESPEYSTGI